jgi:hypothetical protein
VYEDIVVACGGGVNRKKTFISNDAWTICEQLCICNNMRSNLLITTPPVIDPEATKPVAAEPKCNPVMMRRQMEVMITRFPWIKGTVSLCTPTSIGGLGYIQNGLNTSIKNRRILATLVGRNVNDTMVIGSMMKSIWSEEGIYPHPIISVPKETRKERKFLNQVKNNLVKVLNDEFKPGDQYMEVKMVDMARNLACTMRSAYRGLYGYEDKLVRSDYTRRKNGLTRAAHKTFKECKTKLFEKPLSKKYGIISIEKFMERINDVYCLVHVESLRYIGARTDNNKVLEFQEGSIDDKSVRSNFSDLMEALVISS